MRASSIELQRRRIGRFLYGLAAAWLGLSLYLVWIQLIQHDHYRRQADLLQHRRLLQPARRGLIYDRNGTPLAISTTGFAIFADPDQIRDKARAARLLAPVLGMSEQDLFGLINRRGRFVPLLHRADKDLVRTLHARLRRHKLGGFAASPEPMRLYPRGTLACHVLGFVDAEGKGGAGVESAYDRLLRGQDGLVVAEIDARGRIIPGHRVLEQPPVAGADITLTIDARIQEFAEQVLAQAVEQSQARGGTVLVADPATGEVLALANQPSFDPNHYQDYDPQCWNNAAVTSPYEPGSTFKLVVALTALEEKAISPGQVAVHCCGSLPVGHHIINCVMHGHSGGHGTLDLRGIIMKSCNVGAATLGLKLGKRTLASYVHKLGFGQRVGLGLGGETAGFVPPLASWKNITVANVAFGQGVSITPPQLLAAYSAVANGGVLPRLHLVSRVRDGRQVRTFAPAGRRVVSAQSAALLQEYLRDAIEEGTGTLARVPGYTAAGKTGTAQKAPYDSGRYVGSFVGFVPADKPRLAILALIDEPKSSHYGGVVAAPVFREVAELSLAYLSVPPEPIAHAGP